MKFAIFATAALVAQATAFADPDFVKVGDIAKRESGPSPGGGHGGPGKHRRDSGPSPGTGNHRRGVQFEEVEVGGIKERSSGPSPGTGNHKRESGPSPGTGHQKRGVQFEEVEDGEIED
ncbi:hyphally-regulated protein-like [Venturia nashicola]|uniref:Hyphally-regulated protein-like n=1 Tax=Venturia nashicola TaxID=86259 RepID=A0A4Z1PC89_9PEZI|nr:hyphally-regulated protein-like [Venturia nashicola]